MSDIPAAIALMLGCFAVGTALHLAAAMLPGVRDDRGVGARAAALALSGGALALPFWLEGPVLCKALLAQALVAENWRLLEILRTPSRYSRRERALRIALVPYEFSFLERTPRRWPVRDLALSSLLLAVGVTGLVYASRLAAPATPYAIEGWPRWLAVIPAAYIAMEGMTWQWVAVLPAFGWRHRPYQRHPILSRTLAEFWGVRWSSVIHKWLRGNVYEPLAHRRMPRAGVVAAFGMSALLHAYIVWPAAGLVPALWMLGFFLAHALCMIIEAKIGVRRWKPPLGRVFVVVVFVLTVPLFLEPILRSIGL